VFTVQFGSVFIKKSNQTEFFFKKTETESKPVQTDRFRFGSVRFFREKTGSNRFGSVFLVWLGLARFFLVWLGFFGLARFFSGFFGSVFPVSGLKNRNRTEPVCFFKILIDFFLRFCFFGYFFSGFLGLISFSVFLNIPTVNSTFYDITNHKIFLVLVLVFFLFQHKCHVIRFK
jgi:hypothetical protein